MKMIHSLLLAALLGTCFPTLAQPVWFQTDTHSQEAYQMPDQEPKVLNLPAVSQKIPYPVAASRAGIEGWVQVMIQVDATGQYQSHQVVRSAHPVLTKAVVPYVHCLEFQPAVQNGRNVSSWKAVPFRFRIRPGVGERSEGLICPGGKDSHEVRIVRNP